MMKTRPSKPEDDVLYTHDFAGWFVHSTDSRNAEVAKYLDIPYVYCVGQYPGKTSKPDIVFIQPGRSIDPRTKKLHYLVIEKKEDITKVMQIIRRTEGV